MNHLGLHKEEELLFLLGPCSTICVVIRYFKSFSHYFRDTSVVLSKGMAGMTLAPKLLVFHTTYEFFCLSLVLYWTMKNYFFRQKASDRLNDPSCFCGD